MSWDITTIVIVVVAFFAIMYILKLVFQALGGGKADQVSSAQVYKECPSCGWKGVVSKYHRKCSKCGTELV